MDFSFTSVSFVQKYCLFYQKKKIDLKLNILFHQFCSQFAYYEALQFKLILNENDKEIMKLKLYLCYPRPLELQIIHRSQFFLTKFNGRSEKKFTYFAEG